LTSLTTLTPPQARPILKDKLLGIVVAVFIQAQQQHQNTKE